MLERDVKSLISILEESNIEEIEVSTFWGKQNIKLKKKSEPVNLNESKTITSEEKSIEAPVINNLSQNNIIPVDTGDAKPEEQQSKNTKSIKAPLVGTFYLSPKPGEPQYVNEGDLISIGDTLCIIEAMKIFNEIESEISGKITKILVESGTPVEFDQDLFLIEPQ